MALVPLLEVRSWCRPCRAVCVPFSDCVGPLVRDVGAEDLREVLAKLAVERSWRFLELREAGGRAGAAGGAPTYFGHRLCLRGGSDALFAGLTGAARRGVRRARGEGLEVRISRSWRSMRQFVGLHGRTRRRHGAPPQPMAFFRRVHQFMIGPDTGFVVVVSVGGRPVAAAVFLRFGSAGVFKYGASDPAAWPLRPNHLLMWEAIRTLAGAGCGFLHFGRSDPGHDGLRRFKRGWGASEEPLVYERFDPVGNSWASVPAVRRRWAPAVFRRLPLVLNRGAGRLAYRHLD